MTPEKETITPIVFTPNEKRILELGSGPFDQPEHAALRKILDAYPWIIDVVRHNFNKRIAETIFYANAKVTELQKHVNEVIAEEKAKEQKP